MISIRVDHYFHGIGLADAQFNELKASLQTQAADVLAIKYQLAALAVQEEQMASDVNAAITRLTTSVQGLTDAAEGETAVLETISEQIRANVGNAAALNALADGIDAEKDRIVAATLANTPAAPPTTPPDGGPVPPPDGGTPPAGRRG